MVLIIGILSAIALPQYTKSVEKSRISEAKIILKALANAEDVYMLEHGEATANLADLDISVPTETKDWEFDMEETCGGFSCDSYALGAYSKSKRYSILLTTNYGEDNQFLCSPYDDENGGDCAIFGTPYTMSSTGWTVVKMQ